MSGSNPAKAARAAAEWWAERVGAPVHRLAGKDERDFASDFAELAMLVVAARHPVPDSATPGFVDALERLYDELLIRCDGWVSLGVDYGPDPKLAKIAQEHGIHPSRFPMKTNVWVRPDHVTASLGYGGQTRLVWSHPDWVRPTCHSLQYDERTERFGDDRCTLPIYHDGDHGGWAPDLRRCKGCGLSEGGHYNLDRAADYHSFAERRDEATPPAAGGTTQEPSKDSSDPQAAPDRAGLPEREVSR